MEAGSETLEVEVLFFARARELAGRTRATLRLAPGATVADAARRLEEEYPGLAGRLGSCRFALDEEFAPPDAPVRGRSVLAVIPPVSGG